MKKILLLAMVALLFFSGCADQPVDQDNVVNPEDQDLQEDVLPEEISTWVEESLMLFLGQARVYNDKLYLLVTYGEKPTGGYSVAITDITERDDRLEVTINFTDPAEDEMVTQALTYPYELVVIDDPGLPVDFIATGAQEYLPTLYGLEYLPVGNYGSEWIRVFRPQPGDQVEDSIIVEGIGNVFEGNIQYRLLDADGTLLDEGFTTAMMGDWGFYSFVVKTGGLASGSAIVLELFTESAKDGSVENLVSIKLTAK
jgi:hypothetical protein